MSETICTAFHGDRKLACGPLVEVAAVVRAAVIGHGAAALIFDDTTGKVIDLPPAAATAVSATEVEPRGRGRPKLGVVAREVTLLPQHWEWLAAQPGGASVTLRRLVHAARAAALAGGGSSAKHAAAYNFMVAMAGNRPGFEEAARALFAGRYDDLERQMSEWPDDVRTYAMRLARGRPTIRP